MTGTEPTPTGLNALQREALDYYDRGIPSSLPDGNLYRGYVENHRWGYHAVRMRDCPVCIRDRARTTAPCPYCGETFYALPLHDPLKHHVQYCDKRPEDGDDE